MFIYLFKVQSYSCELAVFVTVGFPDISQQIHQSPVLDSYISICLPPPRLNSFCSIYVYIGNNLYVLTYFLSITQSIGKLQRLNHLTPSNVIKKSCSKLVYAGSSHQVNIFNSDSLDLMEFSFLRKFPFYTREFK